MRDFVSTLSPPKKTTQSTINNIIRMEWKHDFTKKETDLIFNLAVSHEKVIKDVIRELSDRAYEMGVEEATEMQRGTILGILSQRYPISRC